MSKRIIPLFTLLIVASMLLAACGGGASQAPEACAENPDESVCAVFEPGETVKIGYAGPMTGDYSAFGIDISQGASIALDNAEPIEGFSYELLVEDTQGSGEGGATVANKYASNPDVVAIAGHTFSGSTEAAIPIYNDARIPMLSPSATMETLTQGDQDVFNRIPFTDDIQGANAAAYLHDVLGLSSIAVMHDGDSYGQGIAETVAAEFEGMGGTVVATEAITPGETDYSPVLTSIAASAPEAIYFGGYYSEAAVLAGNMEVAGLGDAILFSDDGTFGETFLELAGDAGEGVYAGASAEPDPTAEREAFDAAYQEKFGEAPGVLSTFTWHGHDIAAALISAIEEVAILGDDGNLYIPREALVDAVRSLTNFPGLTGPITCNDVGECNTQGPTFFVVEGGAWVVAPGQ
ncbi:MAG: branched-chain amino acid ABC transporter substrate-binding protein [Anaerolineales bacterium]|nr:branched-chain amino acid ABC transporter substrate-binding protein [Anaerolineales bacterium]